MTCPRCQHENSAAAGFCEACGTPLQRPEGSVQPAPSYADLQRVATEALEQQTATAEILRVISRSQTDVQPVFDTIARNVLRLCNGLTAGVFRFDGRLVHLAASHNFESEARKVLEQAYPISPNRENLS